MSKEKPATKLCKHCKTEIAFDAKICPNCKKKQGMSGCLVVILAIVVIGIVGAMLGGGDEKTDATKSPEQTQTSPVTEKDNSATEENNAGEETAQEEQTEEAAPQEPQDTETMGQKNARAKAASYLEYTSFSYSGLITQLEFEGFSTEEATYATDKCGADWNEQAAKKAKSYLEYSSFSRSGLIEQLEFEGFTVDQAEYGATAVGY